MSEFRNELKRTGYAFGMSAYKKSSSIFSSLCGILLWTLSQQSANASTSMTVCIKYTLILMPSYLTCYFSSLCIRFNVFITGLRYFSVFEDLVEEVLINSRISFVL